MRRFIIFVATALVAAMCAAIAVLPAASAARSANGEVVRAWNNLAFDAVRHNNAKDWQAARLYAMVNAAMYDAVNGLANGPERRQAAVIERNRATKGDPAMAAAQAAHDVLTALFPSDVSAYDTRLAADLANGSDPGEASEGARWGGEVARAVLDNRANDGSSPQNLRPFVIADPNAYKAPPPPVETSLDYAAAYNTVRILGDGRNADAAKTDTFWFWALGANTDQPAGAWLQVAQSVSDTRALSLADTSRLFALESLAMVDTVAPTNITKLAYHRQRPTLAITGSADNASQPDAAHDDNPFTTLDTTGWVSRAGVAGGANAEYFSGHSAFASAGAAALTGFFCDDHVPFVLQSDVQNGAPQNASRAYDSFAAAAAETGLSRIYGGQHFPYSNEAGATAGRAIADEVLSKALLVRTGPTHHGACPL